MCPYSNQILMNKKAAKMMNRVAVIRESDSDQQHEAVGQSVRRESLVLE